MKYCSVGSGSCGNCHFIKHKNTNILVDVGLSGKKVDNGLKSVDIDAKDVDAIFITHEHTDHIKGAGILSRRYDIPIYANLETWKAMREKLGKLEDKNMKIFKNDKNYELKDLLIRPFSINHDAANPVGYSFTGEDDKKLSVATDIGNITQTIRQNLNKSDLVVLESNYDKEMLLMGPYTYSLKKRVMSEIGHLSNDEAAQYCVDLVKEGTQKVLLAHLSRENNFPALAYETTKQKLQEAGINIEKDLKLEVLLRDNVSRLFEI